MRSTLAGWPATGSMCRLADGQHGSDQIVQRPGQVVLGDQGNLVINAKMADRPSRNRTVGRHGGQGTREELLPCTDAAGRGGVNHPAAHGAVQADQGHHDPHQLGLSSPAAFRHADPDDGGPRGTPGQLGALLTAESVTLHALTPVGSGADLAHRGSEGFPMMTQRDEQPAADGQLDVRPDICTSPPSGASADSKGRSANSG
jgi:hypothetical protein